MCVRNCKAKMLMLSGVEGGGAEEAAEQELVDREALGSFLEWD